MAFSLSLYVSAEAQIQTSFKAESGNSATLIIIRELRAPPFSQQGLVPRARSEYRVSYVQRSGKGWRVLWEPLTELQISGVSKEIESSVMESFGAIINARFSYLTNAQGYPLQLVGRKDIAAQIVKRDAQSAQSIMIGVPADAIDDAILAEARLLTRWQGTSFDDFASVEFHQEILHPIGGWPVTLYGKAKLVEIKDGSIRISWSASSSTTDSSLLNSAPAIKAEGKASIGNVDGWCHHAEADLIFRINGEQWQLTTQMILDRGT